ncbi:hypothetical protein pdam_00001238 [Pocillopora damicornis]|uniref:FZ domain-containing protein n=1 Tax=Pocillopora damicornis TaxID=46731 RepID=A0A3M6TLF2_POCDA|nr:hypothetical protein pdam_00001238 [Pocillopora damicornis]
MWILAGLLLVSLETLLLDFASGGICQPLNTTLFNSCVQAGYYNSSAFDSGRQGELASLIFNLQKRFNCSSLTNLMTCPLYLPICQSTKLPCKSTCKKFLSDCRNVSSENDGLKALFGGLCGVLPSTRCTSHSTHFNDSGTDNSDITCHKLVLKTCQNMGYNSTSVTTKYQKLVESSTIFNQVGSNSAKLRKVICMEIAPPCDKQNSGKLQVPCRSLCNDAFNESRSQFMKVFKNQKYCSALPNANKSRQELCQLKTWPDNVYYPSGLWMSLNKQAPQKKNPTTLTASETKTTQLVMHQTSRILNTLKWSTHALTSSPIAATTAHQSTKKMSTPAPSATGPTGVTSGISGNTSSPSIMIIAPTSTIEVTTPETSTSKTVSPASTTEAPKPSPSTKVTTSASPTNKPSSPVPSTEETTSSPLTTDKTSASTTKVTTPASPINKSSTPLSSTEKTTSSPPTTEKTSASTTKVITPASPTNKSSTPLSSTEKTTSSPPTTKKTSASTTKGGGDHMKHERHGSSPKVSASKDGKMSGGTIAGIVVGVIALIIAIAAGAVCFRRHRRVKSQYMHSLMVDMDEL